MIIYPVVASKTNNKKPVSPAFRRDLNEHEIKGLIEQTPRVVAHVFDNIGRKEIRAQDGALRTAYALLEKHRSNPWVDAAVELLNKQTRG